MMWTRMGITVAAATAVTSMALAMSTIYLLLADPANFASALDQGSITPIARELATVLLQALRGLLAYL